MYINKMKKLFYILLIALFFCLPSYGQQSERIIRFHSDIAIDTDGRIEVAEHIKVYAAGKEIKRGIYRKIPLSRKNNKGKSVPVDYNVLAVKCNGADSKYRIERESGNLFIYIGDADVLLKAGEYDYTIVYESYGQIGFFDDFDELYWNVTGNEWSFPIEKASAAITLPGNAKGIKAACYTGVKGSTERACTADNRGNIQAFTATRQFDVGEGLTVAAAFPRDLISRPPPPSEAEMFWDEYSDTVFGWTGVLICMLYFYLTMKKEGKKPRKQIAIPTFKPPRNLSPASLIYLNKRKFENSAFTASLVNMAVKGSISIKCEKKNKWTSEYSLVNKMNTEQLIPEEQEIHDAIFTDNDSSALDKIRELAENNPDLKANLNIEELRSQLSEPEVKVDDTNNEKFMNASQGLRTNLGKQWKIEDFFHENFGYNFLGFLILNAVFMLYIFLSSASGDVAYSFFAASFFIVLQIEAVISAILISSDGRNSFASSFFSACFLAFFYIGIVFGIATDFITDDIQVHLPSVLFFSAMSLIYFIYVRRMIRYTEDGAKLAAEFEGFKMYMKTAEEHRLNMLMPPERTPELFEKLLPYAIALGVSNEWCKKFGDVLEKFNYRPQWYNDDNLTAGIATGITAAAFADAFTNLGSSFSSSVGSASAPPVSSSSSGSSDWDSGSDSGDSGGGGGGGGGGGW